MTSSWFFLSTLNYDARSTTHQINIRSNLGLASLWRQSAQWNGPIRNYIKFGTGLTVTYVALARTQFLSKWRKSFNVTINKDRKVQADFQRTKDQQTLVIIYRSSTFPQTAATVHPVFLLVKIYNDPTERTWMTPDNWRAHHRMSEVGAPFQPRTTDVPVPLITQTATKRHQASYVTGKGRSLSRE